MSRSTSKKSSKLILFKSGFLASIWKIIKLRLFTSSKMTKKWSTNEITIFFLKFPEDFVFVQKILYRFYMSAEDSNKLPSVSHRIIGWKLLPCKYEHRMTCNVVNAQNVNVTTIYLIVMMRDCGEVYTVV